MANVTFSPLLEKEYQSGSTRFFDFVTPQRGKTSFMFNTEHRLLMVFDTDDTNPYCRQSRFVEFQIPEGIALDKICPKQLLEYCVNLPFAAKEGRAYCEEFVKRVNRACIAAYHRMFRLMPILVV